MTDVRFYCTVNMGLVKLCNANTLDVIHLDVQHIDTFVRADSMREGKYKYQVAKQKIMDLAKSLPEKAPLPNRNELSGQCGVSRVTLERAISELIGEGVLVSKDGSGTYLNPNLGKAGSEKGKSADNAPWALLVYSVTTGTAPNIVRGVEDFAERHGRSLIICNTDNDPQKEMDYLRRLCKQTISGIILIPGTHSMPDAEVFETLEKKGVAIAACSRQVPGYDFPGTFQNFFQAGFMATQHLLELGCRRIAYLATSRYSTIEDRLQGYLAALSQHNIQYPDDAAHDAFGLSNITENLEERIAEFLRSHPDTDGIYVFIDNLAVPLYAVMDRIGVKPGRDIRVVASDDSGFSKAFSTPLSTVDFPAYKMGASAAAQLHGLLSGDAAAESRHIVLSCELNARQSTIQQ